MYISLTIFLLEQMFTLCQKLPRLVFCPYLINFFVPALKSLFLIFTEQVVYLMPVLDIYLLFSSAVTCLWYQKNSGFQYTEFKICFKFPGGAAYGRLQKKPAEKSECDYLRFGKRMKSSLVLIKSSTKKKKTFQVYKEINNFTLVWFENACK